MTLLEELRQATGAHHEALEKVPFFARLAKAEVSLAAFAAYMRAWAIFYALLEASVPSAFPLNRRPRLPYLLEDIDALFALRVSEIRPVSESIYRLTNQMRKNAHGSPDTALGYLYVLDGSINGLRDCAPGLIEAFSEALPLHYVRYAADQGEREWHAVEQALETVDLAPDNRAVACSAAVELFSALQETFGTIEPEVQPEGFFYTVAALNPEAGMHPCVQDEAVLTQALHAVDDCLIEMPALLTLFGERGRRFTLSDGVFLPTLVELPQAAADKQIAWLKELLAYRGLGSIALEIHVQAIVDRASAAARVAGRLQPLADNLRQARIDRLGHSAFREFSEKLDNQLMALTALPVRSAGMLLASIVIDECNGLPGCAARFLSRCHARLPSAAAELVAEQADVLAGQLGIRLAPSASG